MGGDASLISKGSPLDLASTNEDAKSSDQGTRLKKSLSKFTATIQEKVLDLAELVRQKNSSEDPMASLASRKKEMLKMKSLDVIESIPASSPNTSRMNSCTRKHENGLFNDNESEARQSTLSKKI